MVFMVDKVVVAGSTSEAGVNECAPSLRRYIGGTVSLV